MILLLGGTAETVPISRALVDAGFSVLLSMETSMMLRESLPQIVKRRSGPLDAQGMASVITENKIIAVVDATHPYAALASHNAWHASRMTGVPYFAYERLPSITDAPDICRAVDHDHAARIACSFGTPILLTIGSRHLAPYVGRARSNSIPVIARVSRNPQSIKLCREAGLGPSQILTADGPFSVSENSATIKLNRIGVLVTKDSGDAGGVPAKISAARDAGCRIVVVSRPARPCSGFGSISELLRALRFSLESNVSERFQRLTP
ncbi:MAG: precorrin-6x reductase [Spirochaetes bacterium RBG_16_49_21]|nr:MAG: precorrin-6x reductase [Spirochaetes bacterium RBG_16_49_21]